MKVPVVNTVGQWVEGDRFWGREHEIKALTRYIDEGQNVLIVAPRRVGKTSLMREVSRRIASRYECLHLDLEGSHSPADAIADLACATWANLSLKAKTKSVFKNALASLKQVDSLKPGDLTVTFRDAAKGAWAEKGDALLEAVASCDRPVVLFIDELPILVCRLLKGQGDVVTDEGRDAADRLMSWLRRATQRGGNLRLVLSGSIGLEPVLRQGRLSATINAFTPFSLPAWDPPTAMELVRALADGDRLPHDDGVPAHLVQLLGQCVPYHVQLFFSLLRDRHDLERSQGRTKPCCVDDVDYIYRERMLAPGGHAELAHNEERLRMVLGSEAGLARELLTEAAVARELTDDAAVFLTNLRAIPGREALSALQHTLDVLEHDGYLRRLSGRRVFESNLLRDWWSRRFGLGYVVVVDRPKAS